MIEQINDGKQRVVDMLGKYDTDLVNNDSENESEKRWRILIWGGICEDSYKDMQSNIISTVERTSRNKKI